MKIYYPITVDLYNVYPIKKVIAQQNNIGRGVLITLTAAGAIVDPTGENVTLYAKKPDGKVSYIPCTVSDGIIKADFTNQILALPGDIEVELLIISGSEQISTPVFLLNVQQSNIDDNAIESQNEFTALQQAVSGMNTALLEVEELKKNGLKGDPGFVYTPTVSEEGIISWENNGQLENPKPVDIRGPEGNRGPKGESGAVGIVAYEFDETIPYSIGNCCIYNGLLYKFIAEKEEGAWDESKVTQITLEEMLGTCEFLVDTDGAYVKYTPSGGADPVLKKLGDPEISKIAELETGYTYNKLTFEAPVDGYYVIYYKLHAAGTQMIPNVSLPVSDGAEKLDNQYYHNVDSTYTFTRVGVALVKMAAGSTITSSIYVTTGNLTSNVGGSTNYTYYQRFCVYGTNI